MNFSAGVRVLVKFFKQKKKIQNWGFVHMSTIRKHTALSNGRLPENSKLKVANEQLNGCFGVVRLMTKLTFLAIFGVLITGCIWFLSRDFNGGFLNSNKAQVYLRHANVSSHQLRVLANLFSDSDQVPHMFLLQLFFSSLYCFSAVLFLILFRGLLFWSSS